MLKILCSILLGCLVLVGIVAIPVGLAFLSVKLDKIEPPKWFKVLSLVLFIMFILHLAYLIGSSIL